MEYPTILELEDASFIILPKAKVMNSKIDLSTVQKVIGHALKGDRASIDWIALHLPSDHPVMKYANGIADDEGVKVLENDDFTCVLKAVITSGAKEKYIVKARKGENAGRVVFFSTSLDKCKKRFFDTEANH